jgi:hypothetical protein
MEVYQNNRTIAELNEDCEILIKKEIEKCLINYVNNKPNQQIRKGALNINDISSELKMDSQEMRQLYFSPFNHTVKDRRPKMLPSTSATLNLACPPTQQPRISPKRSFVGSRVKRYIDTPIQATDETYTTVPRSTVLSRVRQHLSKRNSAAQSSEIKYRSIKTQTENCAKHNVAVTVEPLDFIGVYEKGTNVPLNNNPGITKEQATQMYEHITQSELFCIEWIHKNLFEVKLNPNTLVVDDKLRDLSESACVT